MTAEDATQIIVGIHGVGSPDIGEVAQSIGQGYARANPGRELSTESSLLQIGEGTDSHVYQGIRISDCMQALQIWEVNWSDLKGLPKGKVGSAVYALKALIAMIQITDKGWA
jgi:hypothetical protein